MNSDSVIYRVRHQDVVEVYDITTTYCKDKEDLYRDENVPVSSDCSLVGRLVTRTVKSMQHISTWKAGAVVTVVSDRAWHFVDEKGNYDKDWIIKNHIALENVKFYNGLVIRGTLKDTSYYSNKKYCKQLMINDTDKFFTKNGIPVMTAKLVVIEQGGHIFARGIK